MQTVCNGPHKILNSIHDIHTHFVQGGEFEIVYIPERVKTKKIFFVYIIR